MATPQGGDSGIPAPLGVGRRRRGSVPAVPGPPPSPPSRIGPPGSIPPSDDELLKALNQNPGSVIGAIETFMAHANTSVSQQVASMASGQQATGTDPYLLLAQAEAGAQIAKYGFPPMGSPSGVGVMIDKLIDARRQLLTLDAEAEAKISRLIFDGQMLQAKVEGALEQARTQSQHDALKARMEADQTGLAHELAQLNADVVRKKDEAKRLDGELQAARDMQASRLIDVEKRTTDEIGVMELAVSNKKAKLTAELAGIETSITAAEKKRSLLRRKYVRPALIVLIPLLIVSNLIGDVPGQGGTLLFGQIDALWDLFYDPLRDGIGNSIDGFRN